MIVRIVGINDNSDVTSKVNNWIVEIFLDVIVASCLRIVLFCNSCKGASINFYKIHEIQVYLSSLTMLGT